MGLLKRAVLLLATTGCVPDVDVDLSLVEEPVVLAVRAVPAETEPGTRVGFETLYVDPGGPLSPRALDWSFCTARTPLAELGPVARICLDATTDELEPIANGALRVAGVVPDDACRLFGPEPPPAEAGEPAGRPVDPDPSGGYYQPVRVQIGTAGDIVFHGVRLQCGLAGADQQQAAEFRQTYLPNVDPRVDTIEVAREDEDFTAVDPAVPFEVGVDESLALRIAWAECEAGTACTGAEHYVHFDPITLELGTRREALSIGWFTTAGTFDDARTGRSESELERDSTNGWTAPEAATDVSVWLVIRDDRGGVSWRSFAIAVR